MKRIIVLLAAVMMLMTGCSKPEKKETLKDVPSGFCRRFEEAQFSKYNSYASENGLGGSRIWMEGTYTEVNTIDNEGMSIMFTTLKDKDGNEWILVLDVKEAMPLEFYERSFDHQLVVTGVYDGYSDVYDKPVVYLTQLFDRNSGNITTSAAFASMAADNTPAPEPQPDPQPAPEPEPEPEQSEGIRSDIKEAIDAYEDFIDEYIDFMQKYEESDNSVTMLADYMVFMSKMTAYSEKMEKLEDDLNDAEYIYFYEVMSRCNTKLLKYMQ